MRVTILGCGSSQGVPRIGGDWGACDPAEPRNRRLRPSILVEWDGLNILVDTSPDLRQQLLAAGVARLDAVLFTHAHADHVHGIDDLRGIERLTGARIEVFAEAPVMDEITARFPYLFLRAPVGPEKTYPPFLVPKPTAVGDFTIQGRPVGAFTQEHGDVRSTGFRFDKLAYSTDAVALPESSLARLAGIDTWIVDCLRLAPAHPTHAHWPVTESWLDRVQPRRAILTHMNHQSDYRELDAATPEHVAPGHDGMVIEIS